MGFKSHLLDAKRYRALQTTEKASPWADVLGPHKSLRSLADALIQVQKESERQRQQMQAEEMGGGGEGGGGEGAANTTANVEGLRTEPVIRRRDQVRLFRRNKKDKPRKIA